MNLSSIFRNESEKRFRAGWRILGYQFLLVLVLLVLEDYASAPIKPLLRQDGLRILEAVIGSLAFGISVWLAGKWLDHRPFVDFGFHLSPQWLHQSGLGAALGALLTSFIFLTELSLGYVRVIQFGYTMQADAPLAWALLVMFIHYMGVSFAEEIIARGPLMALNVAVMVIGRLISSLSAVRLWTAGGHTENTIISALDVTLALGILVTLIREQRRELEVAATQALSWTIIF